MARIALFALILALNITAASAKEKSEYEASVITLGEDLKPSTLYCGGSSYLGGGNISFRVLSRPGFSSILLTQKNEKVFPNPEILFQAEAPLTLVDFLNAGAQYPKVVLPQAARDFFFQLNGSALKPLMELMPNPYPRPSIISHTATNRLGGSLFYEGHQYTFDCSGAVIRIEE